MPNPSAPASSFVRRRLPAGSGHVVVLAVLIGCAAHAASVAASRDPCAEDGIRASAAGPCGPRGAPSPAQVAASKAEALRTAIDDDARRMAVRTDRRLLDRFPDEASQRRAEVAELAIVTAQLQAPLRRLAELLAERGPLDVERQFYQGKRLPAALQLEVDTSDARLAALTDVFRGLEQDVAVIVAKFGHEREHLRKLWAGALPGSFGIYTPLSPASSPR